MGVRIVDEGVASGTLNAFIAAETGEELTGVVAEKSVRESKLSVVWKFGGSNWVSIVGAGVKGFEEETVSEGGRGTSIASLTDGG